MSDSEILARAIKTYGEEAQQDMMIEGFIGWSLRHILKTPKIRDAFATRIITPKTTMLAIFIGGTDQENQNQAWADGLHKSEKAVKQINSNGNVVAIYKSQADAARKTGNSQQNISACVNGKRKTTGGYVWQKLD